MHRPGGSGAFLRKINAVAVLRVLFGADVVTLREIADAAGVSRNTVEDALVSLVRSGLAEEVAPNGDDQRPIGRPAKRYRLRPEYGHVVGVDLGVYEINVLVTDLRGRKRVVRNRPLAPEATAADRVAAAREAIRGTVRRAGVRRSDVLAVGVATTGIVDAAGRLVRSSRLPILEGRNLADDLAVFPNAPVIVGNDARLAALAERWVGVARDLDNFVNILAGRHITSSIVLDGQLFRGARGAAGEIGFLAESGWKAALDTAAAWPEGVEETVRAAAHGDPAAVRRVDGFAGQLAVGIAAVALTVDPECIVLSGGLSRAGDTLLEPLRRHLDSRTLFPIPLRTSELDRDAVGLGAVRVALDHVEGDLFDPHSALLAAVLGA
ncbi:ROK family transcriptional regulator [Yinghuangia seranimata]|uniref:ROK family transcriptional regulator n=1 Tax=Yinghuangia seranimata TaxID=408067 RepID=UPI00248CECA8|nr:ROK family protein [Yinghuangia seranimata]MDI2129491.1 ROK family protein [Yinghuangia seranimata]